jgi:hypothetical protein
LGDRLGQIKKAKTTRLAAFDLRRVIKGHDNSQFVFVRKMQPLGQFVWLTIKQCFIHVVFAHSTTYDFSTIPKTVSQPGRAVFFYKPITARLQQLAEMKAPIKFFLKFGL